MNFRRFYHQVPLWISCATACLGSGAQAAVHSIDTARISEVVRIVEVRSEITHRKKSAKVNDSFSLPDVMSTGPSSRAELIASDGTVTRVGANTIFSFSLGKRELNLERGTVLFHSPTGRGGGMIRTSNATAGVIGTSIIVSATKDGGFKLLVLEGKAKATLPDGKSVSLGAGQLTFILPGNTSFGPTINFRLSEQVKGSKLVNGFKSPIASQDKIAAAAVEQEKKIASGDIEATTSEITDRLIADSLQTNVFLRQSEVRPVPRSLNAVEKPKSEPLGY